MTSAPTVRLCRTCPACRGKILRFARCGNGPRRWSAGSGSRAMADHSLPRDLDVEQAILGAAMVDATGLEACLSLKPADFTAPHHVEIFEAICELARNGHKVHRTTVAYQLRQQNPSEIYAESTLQ